MSTLRPDQLAPPAGPRAPGGALARPGGSVLALLGVAALLGAGASPPGLAGADAAGGRARVADGTRAPALARVAAADAYQALLLTRVTPPSPAQAFRSPAPDGSTTALEDHRGKAVLLNFWATWCPPCREEMPSLQRLATRFRDRGLAVLAVSLDAEGDPAVAEFLRDHGLTFPVALDPHSRIAREYRVRALPATFLIDRQGRIVATAYGPRQWDGPEAVAAMEQLLASRAGARGLGPELARRGARVPEPGHAR